MAEYKGMWVLLVYCPHCCSYPKSKAERDKLVAEREAKIKAEEEKKAKEAKEKAEAEAAEAAAAAPAEAPAEEAKA